MSDQELNDRVFGKPPELGTVETDEYTITIERVRRIVRTDRQWTMVEDIGKHAYVYAPAIVRERDEVYKHVVDAKDMNLRRVIEAVLG